MSAGNGMVAIPPGQVTLSDRRTRPGMPRCLWLDPADDHDPPGCAAVAVGDQLDPAVRRCSGRALLRIGGAYRAPWRLCTWSRELRVRSASMFSSRVGPTSAA